MKLRAFEESLHYVAISKWWTSRDLPVVPTEILPPTGVIAESGSGDFLAAAWMYHEESGRLAVIDWITTNPDMPIRLTSQGVEVLLDFLKTTARENGCRNVISWAAKDTGLQRMMVRSGWTDQKSVPHTMLFQALA